MNKKIFVSLVMLLSSISFAHASIVISGTRVIYPSNAKEVNLTLTNNSQIPVLMQAWLDNGDESSKPQDVNSVFFITPQVARIDKNKSLSLRILKMEEADELPKDRESLFYLNVLDIPPEKKTIKNDGAEIQFTVRSRIKFLYRPDGLPDSANDAPSKLIFKVKGNDLLIENPSPYFVNLSSLELDDGSVTNKVMDYRTLAPFSTKHESIKNSSGKYSRVNYSSINDLGGIFVFKKNIAND